jgi:hypothetical protein
VVLHAEPVAAEKAVARFTQGEGVGIGRTSHRASSMPLSLAAKPRQPQARHVEGNFTDAASMSVESQNIGSRGDPSTRHS